MNSEKCYECGQTIGESDEARMDLILKFRDPIGALELLITSLKGRLKSAQLTEAEILRAQIKKIETVKCDLLDLEEEIHTAVQMVIARRMGHA